MSTAVLITGTESDDLYFHRALSAGFDIVGTWQAQQGVMGGPMPSLWVSLRRTVPTPYAGVADRRRGDSVPEEWFK